jgi:hypothetical protein
MVINSMRYGNTVALDTHPTNPTSGASDLARPDGARHFWLTITISCDNERNKGMPTLKLPKAIIEAAIEGFEAQKARIDTQIAELRAMIFGSPEVKAATEPGPRRRKMSAAGRKAIAAAQRARWAAVKVGAAGGGTPPKPKAKRKLSAAGRANIVAALKKRWAVKKAAAKK